MPPSIIRPERIAFIDEAGDYGLEKIDPRFPVFASCAYTCTSEEYFVRAVPALMRLKYEFFGSEAVVIHGHKIRQKADVFSVLENRTIQDAFMDAVARTISELDGVFIAAAVDKAKLKLNYAAPESPFFLTLKFMLERLHMHWNTSPDRPLLCVFEERGREEDARTRAWFDEICSGNNFRRQIFSMKADFRSKAENIIGHQYADLASYSIARFVQSGNGQRKDWQCVRDKLRTNNGKYEGFGLKIFP